MTDSQTTLKYPVLSFRVGCSLYPTQSQHFQGRLIPPC